MHFPPISHIFISTVFYRVVTALSRSVVEGFPSLSSPPQFQRNKLYYSNHISYIIPSLCPVLPPMLSLPVSSCPLSPLPVRLSLLQPEMCSSQSDFKKPHAGITATLITGIFQTGMARHFTQLRETRFIKGREGGG